MKANDERETMNDGLFFFRSYFHPSSLIPHPLNIPHPFGQDSMKTLAMNLAGAV